MLDEPSAGLAAAEATTFTNTVRHLLGDTTLIFFAGVAGVLFAPLYKIMVPTHLGLTTSASVMLMVIIGGAGTLFGPAIGAALIVLLEHFASIYTPERWPLILGVVFVICVLFMRGGFGIYLSKFWRKVRPQDGNTESRELI